MDNSKINQTELDYSCSAGNAKVNLTTGRLLFEHKDVSVGIQSYKLDLSHIYNSHFELPVNLSSNIGNKWKLNIEQYVFTQGLKYYYVDGAGMTIEFVCSISNIYYDTSGLGMKLTVNENQVQISDMANNQMFFENNRLTKMVSAENHSIIKKIIYKNDKIISMYDSRKPFTEIAFQYYENGLLKSVRVIVKGKEQYILRYYYENDKLVFISKIIDGYEKTLVQFKYKNDWLEYAASLENCSAMRFVSSNNKVTEVNIGVVDIKQNGGKDHELFANPDVYTEKSLYAGEKSDKYTYSIEKGVNELYANLLTYNCIEYQNNRTIVKNEKNIKMVYYLNSNGYTVSILESLNNDNSDLRTLKKMPGYHMLNENGGTDNEKINSKNAFLINTNTVISTDENSLMHGRLSDLDYYRGNVYYQYCHYVCSFWLKVLDEFNNPKVRLSITSNGHTDTNIVSFDDSAIFSWQEVRIPIKITNSKIDSIHLDFLEKDKEIKIADMKLYYSSTYRTMITDGTTSRCLDEINKIEYVLVSNPSESRTIELNNETFITEKDLQMTYTEKFKLYGNSNNMDDFPFFYNDGTKCIMVKQALLWIDDGTHYSISFGNDDYNNPILPRYIGSRNTRAQYFTEVLSPDENIRIYNIPHFINNHNINGKTYKCMCLITEGNRYAQDADDHKESFELKCVDLSGKTLLEQDEYGVQMIYEYDINGIMHKKILTNKNDSSQKIVYTTTTSESSQTINDGFVCQKNTYNEQNSSLLQSELYGNDEPSEEKQITNYKYGFFNEELKQVNNEIGGHNFITYGKYGRIVRVTPKKADDNDRYGFKFQYDSFGEPIKFLYSYKTSEGVVDDVLVEKVIDRQNGCVTTRHKRSDEEIDSTTTTIDKYGRIAEMDISGQKVKYTRDSLLESPGAANVNKIEDHVDGTIHNFKYDEDYNLKSYSTIYENGSSLTMEKMSEREITCTETFPSDSNLQDSTSISEINYDENVILSARIKQTNHYMVYGNKGNPIDYEYDALGRINRKQMSIYEGWSTPGTTIAASKEFVDGTNLLKKKTILLDNDWMRDTLFEFSCNYNSKQYLKSRGLKITCKDDIRTYNQTYEYNKANQLVKECNLRTGHEKNYSYNDDGSINSVTSFGLKENYHYQKGRLSSITCEPMLNSISINYDNLGNVTEIGGKNYTWERGNLLKSYKNSDQTTQYFYNGFGKKIKKILPNGTIITYNYDNEKLISENWSTGLKIRYLYDLEGILGFYLEKDGYGSSYFYIKDEQGNVVSILDNDLEIVHYEYDAYGNITIAYSDDDGVAEINPIRWKGLYCETESDLYFINGNTYLPSLRQNLSMNIIEEIVQNSFTINALYPYQITSTNPIELAFSNHNIFSGLDLVYAPPAKSKWSRLWNEFWKSDVGKILAVEITLFACALSIITGTFGCFLIGLAGVGVTLLVGSIISGVIGKKTGKGFWNSFFNYLNDNWAQTLAIEMALFIVSIGVSKLFKGFTDCFIKGTLVLTSIGLLKIEDIKEGDEVWAYNEETGEKALKKVVNLFRKETKEWMHLFVENPISKVTEEIICTPSHRIYIEEKGWLKASEILVNDEVLLYNNNSGIVRKIELEKLEHPEVTYNFEVEDYHNYFVSEESVLVHNDCNPIDSINNCKYKEYANSYDEAMEMAKQKGGVSGNPESAKPNVYGGYDYRFYRKTKQDRDFPVDILEHMTGHPNRKITRHLNVIGVDGKNWHIFF